MQIFLSSARTVSSSQDFGVEQFFRADEFRAVDPSPFDRFVKLKKQTFFVFILTLFKFLANAFIASILTLEFLDTLLERVLEYRLF
jgi:hypothetical protein